MRIALWPHHSAQELESEIETILANPQQGAVFVAEKHGGGLCGFAEVSLKDTAPGCTTCPVGYLEAWYVDADKRRQGIGGLLVCAAEAWARKQGCQEMASDALCDNAVGRDAHAALGYDEEDVLVHFRKWLMGGM